jgi:hypothetical protein
LTETSIELGAWLPFSGRSKLAVRKARHYFIARDKHVFYGRVGWSEQNAPKSIPLVGPDPIVVYGAQLAPVYGAVRLVSTGVKSPRGTTHEYVKTVSKLIELLELPGGWNSYNAKPISKENVTFAVALLGRLMRESTPAPLVVPKVRGGVQLEWHTRGIDIEIAIDSPERVSFFAEDLRGAQEPLEGPINERVLGKWIDRLSE